MLHLMPSLSQEAGVELGYASHLVRPPSEMKLANTEGKAEKGGSPFPLLGLLDHRVRLVSGCLLRS